jgi:serine protease
MRNPRVLLAACAALQLSACAEWAETPEEMSFEEFEAQTYREPWEHGVYIVDGDEPVLDEAALRERFEGSRAAESSLGTTSSALIVNRVGTVDDRWSDQQKLSLTYCVSNGFGTSHAAVVEALSTATASWESAGRVNFVYKPALDGSCNASQAGVLFDVRPVNNAGYAARGFYPHYPRASRTLFIDSSVLSAPVEMNLLGVVRHELGHTLGFRHEHTRPESGACFEDNNWRPLSVYDRSSVMHSPQCNGFPDSTMELTSTDRSGMAELYGAAGSGQERTSTFTGSLAQNTWSYRTFSVAQGSTFRAVTSGTGDVDLYLRFDGNPTRTIYSCRSWEDGSAESCTVTVPSSATTVVVGLHAYAAHTSYNLRVTYVTP